MKITVVAMEAPFPPIHGGRVDIWRRLQVLAKLGVQLQLICWSKGELPPLVEANIKAVVDSLHVLQLNGTNLPSLLKKIISLPQYPLELSSRLVYGQALTDLYQAAQTFAPDLVMIDHLHGCIAGRQLHQYLGVPLILRSHNIEHLYGRNLFKSAQGFRKVLRMLSLNGLERIEKATLRECTAFYDISVDDLAYWQSLGFSHGHFLPPLTNLDMNSAMAHDPSLAEGTDHERYDVVFLGNLNTENNVAGIEWFLTQVSPLLHKERQDIKILIAGSNPVKKMISLCDAFEYVTLKANPESAADIYQSGRVLINPNAVGGGVSIKAIDMLAAGRPIVTLASGIKGLPEAARGLFQVATDATSFAEKILFCLSHSGEDLYDPVLIDTLFGVESVRNFISDLESNILSNR